MKKKLAFPYIVWSAVFVIIPLLLVLYYSLTVSVDGRSVFSLQNYQRFFEYAEVGGKKEYIYLEVLGRSVGLAVSSTILCFILGYPVAYIMAGKEYRSKTVLSFLFIVPMWMNYLLRTYAWQTILAKNGVINTVLSVLGLPNLNLLNNANAVLLGMVYNFLPFMILPIYTVLKKMDDQLIEAAQDLGAGRLQVFLRVVFPLSLPGVVSGVTMVFMPAVTTFIISNLLGGGHVVMIGNLIEQQFKSADNKNFGSAISVIMIAMILVSMWVFSVVDKDGEGGALI